NPWIDAIDPQPSAAPYNDWNARIAAECYAPNTAARILDARGRIQHIVNNYAWMSFNVGPTLMRWLAQHDRATYHGIIAADHEGRQRFGGHGPAIAQVYGHLIMPLATPRDRRTQVAWGVADFVHHYGRQPEGMWLAEAAVCTDSLEALAEYGIKYTILAPHQAGAVRMIGTDEWHEVDGQSVDTTMPYLVQLPSGRQIAIFFYNGGVSQAIAFQGMLQRGESLAQALLTGLDDGVQPRLAHVATDGETYGHHHRHGEMALAYAIHHIHTNHLARITVYGEYLELHPPTHHVRIVEQSSWSCAHGVERWRSDCGCHSGGEPGWNQAWRGPLRTALDWARESIDRQWEQHVARYFARPWQARDAYIAIINAPSDTNIDQFLRTYGRTKERWPALGLLELQRQLMQSFTSCAWFFNDVAGIETVQVLRYAARMIQLAEQVMGLDLEEGFHEQLERVVSNTGVTAAQLYAEQVKPHVLSLADVCAHDALTAVFGSKPDDMLYLHQVHREAQQQWKLDDMAIAVGVSQVMSVLTGEQQRFVYGVVFAGAQVLAGGVRPAPERYQRLLHNVSRAVTAHQREEVERVMIAELGQFEYSLRSIFRPEQRGIMRTMLTSVMTRVQQQYHDMYHEHASVMRFLDHMGMTLPRELQVAAAMALQADIRAALTAAVPATATVIEVVQSAQQSGVVLDKTVIAYEVSRALQRVSARLVESPCHIDFITIALDLVQIATPYDVDLWMVQNNYNVVWQRDYHAMVASAERGHPVSATWVTAFRELGVRLNMAIVIDE
ncbi:MAG: DUF3536 domain-containing protein, partial [Chloroflexi bacterium]|nr:DUF3536 domain-containing protein [Chloroflexota bacterium]